MKLDYQKKQLRFNLIFGTIWLGYFFFKLFYNNTMHWLDYGWAVIAISYLSMYFYQKKYGYVTISNNELTLNGPFGKKINLDKVYQIKKFAGDYILVTPKKKVSINGALLSKNQLNILESELKKLKTEWL
ncbi:hypothetical protein ACFSQP_11870 [Bizionia sediminis]|uniref:PH domain-containing protein n=1 Tax=Bizionia sediminis TaxID=1737064 RepID=A0ABW5KUI2_9FLAO